METLFYTPAQKRITALQEWYPSYGICNIAGRLRFEKSYSVSLLEEMVKLLVDELPVLRIRINEQHQPYLSDGRIELKQWPGDSRPDMEQLSEWLKVSLWKEHQPLCEFMYCHAENRTELYVKVHHVLLDSYGIVLSMNRLVQILDCLEQGEPRNSTPDLRFLERMSQAHKPSEKDREWLQRCLSDGFEEVWRQNRSGYGKINSARKRYHLPEELLKKMKQEEGRSHNSLEVMITAATAIYFSKISRTERFVCGRTLANRRKADMDLPAMMANTLPLFLKPEKNKTFLELCGEIKSFFYEMMRHSNLDMEQIRQEAGRSQDPYDVMITYRKQRYIPFLQGIEQQEIYNPYLELPLRIYVDELESEVRFDFQYQTEVYEEKEIDALFLRLMAVLEQGLGDRKIKEISVLSAEDQKLWDRVNQTKLPSSVSLVPEKIISWAQREGGRMAYCYHGTYVTYAQMVKESDRIASFLIDQGIKSGDIVGVCIHAPERIPGVYLGIWRSGAAFLPVNPDENRERLEEIRNMCGFFVDDSVCDSGFPDIKNRNFPVIQPEQPAYCLFTSGSSGKAKAAVLTHKSLAYRLEWMESQYHCKESVLQKASCTFDVSMWEYFLPLSEGGCVYLLSEKEKKNPSVLLTMLRQYGIQTVHFVPSLLSVFLTYAEEYGTRLPELKHVFCSGEALSSELVQRFYRCFPEVSLHNLYGPTECTIDVTYYNCQKEDKRIPIGRPVWGTHLQILNDDRQCMPPGVEGELSVSGVLVGNGYLGQKSEKFRCGTDGERIYDTGDRAMLGFDGQIYYLGRKDSQCKINGMRVDLSQIEAVMLEYPSVLGAAVLCVRKSLVGFYMAEKELPGLEVYLRQSLPYYSVPQKLIFCQDIPLNQNGKMDRKYLEKLLEKPEMALPKTEKERRIWELISEKLGKKISVEENFFLAGVDSLMVMDLVIELEKMGLSYEPEDFYQSLTVRNLAAGSSSGYCWLTRKGSSSLVIAFPYAGGAAEDYLPVVRKLGDHQIDFCVAGKGTKIPDTEWYDRIVLLGYCTGCAEALQAAELLCSRKKKIAGMILCGAIPPSRTAALAGSPWKYLSDRRLGVILDYLHGTPIHADEQLLRKFRMDAEDFYHYFGQKHEKIPADAILFFGDRDALTFPVAHRWKRWNNYLDGELKCRILQKKGHFFLKGGSRQIAAAVLELIK